MNVKNRQGRAVRGDAQGADRRRRARCSASAATPTSSHRGDRAARRRHARRALPPLPATSRTCSARWSSRSSRRCSSGSPSAALDRAGPVGAAAGRGGRVPRRLPRPGRAARSSCTDAPSVLGPDRVARDRGQATGSRWCVPASRSLIDAGLIERAAGRAARPPAARRDGGGGAADRAGRGPEAARAEVGDSLERARLRGLRVDSALRPATRSAARARPTPRGRARG